jgi:P27 family predicted phage terminase small subunit
MPNPPKPVERKRRTGNPGKRPIRAAAVLVPAADGVPAAPADLGDHGRSLWALVWTDGGSWIAPTDVPLVRLLCRATDELASWLALIEAEGRVFTTKGGMKRVHPGVGQVRELERQITGWLSLMGFTPTDRARLAFGEVRTVSELADLLDRRRHDLGR